MRATRMAFNLAIRGYFSFREFVREAARVCVIWMGGPTLFLKLKARR
jgi:hypothetical protein